MRGGSVVTALFLSLSACSAPSGAGPPPSPVAPPVAEVHPQPTPPIPLLAPQPAPLPILEGPGGGGIKGAGPGVVPTAAEPPARKDPGFDDVLKLQKQVAGKNPESEDERLRLALLHASQGDLEEAERVLSTLKNRTHRLVPYLELFLKRELGDHKEAAKALAELAEQDRKAAGFGIERAELCTRVKRYREYTAAGSDRVTAGGLILIYVEPRNYALRRREADYILHLKYDWKLFDERSAELPVQEWDQAKPEDREDRVTYAGPVSEFYQTFKLKIPATLAPGKYRVRVTVTDVAAGKSDRIYLPITVAAGEKGP